MHAFAGCVQRYQHTPTHPPTRYTQMLAEGSLSVDDLCLTFTTHDALGREVELLPHGAGIDVTEDNKHEYISLLTQHKLLGAVKEQTGAFLKGWQHVIPPRILDLMSRCVCMCVCDAMGAMVYDVVCDKVCESAYVYAYLHYTSFNTQLPCFGTMSYSPPPKKTPTTSPPS